MNIFLSPHNDDEALFGSYIIQRSKPLVIVCFDGTQHEEKFGITVKERQAESEAACKAMGVKVQFLEIPDNLSDEESRVLLYQKLMRVLPFQIGWEDIATIFVPSETGGNRHHDIVSRVLRDGDGLMYYSTYTKEDNGPVPGEMAINPTESEKEMKEFALSCYPSQHKINPQFFESVKNKPEYLSFKP